MLFNYIYKINKRSKMYKIKDISKTASRKTPTKHISQIQVLFIVLATLLMSIFVADTAPVENQAEIIEYLSKFGYLELPSAEKNSGLSQMIDLRSAVEDFQSFAGIEVTGQVDKKSLEIMSIPRCGIQDKYRVSSTNNRSKRHGIVDSFWAKKTLTYAISKYPKILARSVVDTEIQNAFKAWSEQTDLSFIATETGSIDINIRFEENKHNCAKDFDGPKQILAHAFFPKDGGSVHFDDSEHWTVNIDSANDIGLFQVAIHEFGHALGLYHSTDPSAVMAPFYEHYKTRLTTDDIMGIETIYGMKTNRSIDVCRDPKIDTLFYSPDGQMYAFKGQMYYQIKLFSDVPGYPKKISERWPNLPGDIDAAFTHKDKKTYFFKGSKYWRYTGQHVDRGYPKEISEDFPGIPNHLDTALAWLGNTKIYFFKGSKVWLFDTLERKVMSTYPKLISKKWKGLPDNIDAAIQRTNGYTAYFKDDKHYRIKNRQSSVDADYPKPLGDILFNCVDPSTNY